MNVYVLVDEENEKVMLFPPDNIIGPNEAWWGITYEQFVKNGSGIMEVEIEQTFEDEVVETELECISFEPYPEELAYDAFEKSREKHFKVTTINWAIAIDEDGKPDHSQVHKIVYDFTLNDLIEWVRKPEDVDIPQAIIDIEPM